MVGLLRNSSAVENTTAEEQLLATDRSGGNVPVLNLVNGAHVRSHVEPEHLARATHDAESLSLSIPVLAREASEIRIIAGEGAPLLVPGEQIPIVNKGIRGLKGTVKIICRRHVSMVTPLSIKVNELFS